MRQHLPVPLRLSVAREAELAVTASTNLPRLSAPMAGALSDNEPSRTRIPAKSSSFVVCWFVYLLQR
jgi:hypothetical protein